MFRGVTSERTLDDDTVIVDIGGGSTELVAGGPDGVRWHDSLDIGSVRLTERFLASDPPSEEELESCATAVRALLAERVPDEIRGATRSAVGVAGTITSIAALALGLEEYDRDSVHGFELAAEALDKQLHRLASVPSPNAAPQAAGSGSCARDRGRRRDRTRDARSLRARPDRISERDISTAPRSPPPSCRKRKKAPHRRAPTPAVRRSPASVLGGGSSSARRRCNTVRDRIPTSLPSSVTGTRSKSCSSSA